MEERKRETNLSEAAIRATIKKIEKLKNCESICIYRNLNGHLVILENGKTEDFRNFIFEEKRLKGGGEK